MCLDGQSSLNTFSPMNRSHSDIQLTSGTTRDCVGSTSGRTYCTCVCFNHGFVRQKPEMICIRKTNPYLIF